MKRDQTALLPVPGYEVGAPTGALSTFLDAVANGRITESKAEWNKTLNYQELSVNYLFQPVEFELFGRIGSLTVKLSSSVTYLT